jgi:hypothetical protein
LLETHRILSGGAGCGQWCSKAINRTARYFAGVCTAAGGGLVELFQRYLSSSLIELQAAKIRIAAMDRIIRVIKIE